VCVREKERVSESEKLKMNKHFFPKLNTSLKYVLSGKECPLLKWYISFPKTNYEKTVFVKIKINSLQYFRCLKYFYFIQFGN